MNTAQEVIDFVNNTKHQNGAYISRPDAVHTYECPYWRVGKRHGACVCGAVQLQHEIDKVFGG